MNKKLAIITGSSKGIGAGIAECFLRRNNWFVWGIARNSNSQNASNENYSEILGDLTSPEPLKQLKEKLPDFLAKYEIAEICLIHNSGYTHNSHLLELSDEIIEKTFDLNIKVPFAFTREISPLMPRGSSHIYIGSTLSTMAVANSAAYVSSKHALAGLMRSAAIDLASCGLRCNLVCPGFTETDMAKDVISYSVNQRGGSLEEGVEAIAKQSPLGRLLKPQEIGDFVLYLAEHSTISGEILHINGGFGLV